MKNRTPSESPPPEYIDPPSNTPRRRRPSMFDKAASKPDWDGAPSPKPSATSKPFGDLSKFIPDPSFEYQPPSQADDLNIPMEKLRNLEREGYVLQWTCHESYGQPQRSITQAQQAGWVPVAIGDLGGHFDYLLSEGEEGAPIQVGGLTLTCRPKFIHDKAKLIEKRLADEALTRTKTMTIDGLNVPGGNHPSAIRGNKINAVREGMEIPRNLDY